MCRLFGRFWLWGTCIQQVLHSDNNFDDFSAVLAGLTCRRRPLQAFRFEQYRKSTERIVRNGYPRIFVPSRNIKAAALNAAALKLHPTRSRNTRVSCRPRPRVPGSLPNVPKTVPRSVWPNSAAPQSLREPAQRQAMAPRALMQRASEPLSSLRRCSWQQPSSLIFSEPPTFWPMFLPT